MASDESAQSGRRCRTCNNANSWNNDFHALSECLLEYEKTVADLLLYICHIDDKILKSFELPTEICNSCTQRLREAYNFAQQAQKVQMDLVAAIKSDINSKLPDCLLEPPIDLPNDQNKCLPIKIEEVDVKVQNIFKEFSSNHKQQQSQQQLQDHQLLINEKPKLNADVDNNMHINNFFIEFDITNAIKTNKSNFCTTEFITSQENIFLDSSSNNQIEDPITIVEKDDNLTENNKRYQMDVCNKNVSLNKMQRHRDREKNIERIKNSNFMRYFCDVCEKSFTWKKDLTRHMNYHFGDVELRCKYCDNKYLRRDKFLKHLKSHGVEIEREKLCNYRSSWKFADYLYTEKRFRLIQCKLCDQKFENTNTLRVHISQHQQTNALNFDINNEVLQLFNQTSSLLLDDIKEQIFDDIKKKNFFKFYEIVNVNGYEMGLSDSDAEANVENSNSNAKYKCSLCSKEFRRKFQTISHTKEEHINATLPYNCNVCKVGFVCDKIYESHVKTHCHSREKIYKCRKCPGKFMWLKNLEAHNCSNNEKASALLQKRELRKCKICNETFLWFIDLKKHMQEHHEHSDNNFDGNNENAGYLYSLGLCKQKKEVSKKNNADIKQEDGENDALCTNENKFSVCGIETENKVVTALSNESCEKYLISTVLQKEHLQSKCPNKIKKFKCHKCPAHFVWERTLKQHVKLKHTTSIEANKVVVDDEITFGKKLQCDICYKVFIWPKDLTRHKRIHLPEREKFECPICNRKFNRKDNMKKHLKVHNMITNLTIVSDREELQQHIKPVKCKGIDQQLCKSNGCKLIQCMICLSKHTTIFDLRNHLNSHQTVIDFAKREMPIHEFSQLLYPSEPIMNEVALKERIVKDICSQNYDNFYSITNEGGYELSIESSETDSDEELKNNDVYNVYNDDDKNKITPKCNIFKTYQNYKCEICFEHFSRKYKLFQHHLQYHEWQEAPHSCVHCYARFLSMNLLQHHYKIQCKNTNKKYICRKCPLRFRWKENLNIHMRIKHADYDDAKKINNPHSFKCTKCYRNFQTLKDLTRHFVCHRSDTDLFKCLWCPRKFTREDNQYRHMVRHGITRETFETAKSILKATNSVYGSKQIFCKICNTNFQTIRALRSHLLELHQITNDSCCNYSIVSQQGFELYIDDSETDSALEGAVKGNKEIQQQRLYTCVICKLICKRKYELAKHQLVMHKPEVLPLKCEKCVFKTVAQEILDHHKKTQCYNVEKKFECNKCHFKFMWLENLERHQQLLHVTNDETENNLSNQILNILIFPCNQCERKYTRRDRLVNHIKKMHTKSVDIINSEPIKESKTGPASGEKENKSVTASTAEKKYYLCSFCGRALTSSSNLIIHMRRHTGEKPFKCDLCDMAFPRSSDLQCHRRKHTGEKPHKCTVCEKAFSRSYKLQTHMRIHSGERPYKCTYCEKSFTQCNDLTLHIRRHTGERPYVCGICGEGFIQGTALRNHRTQRGHHENVEPKRRTLLQQF